MIHYRMQPASLAFPLCGEQTQKGDLLTNEAVSDLYTIARYGGMCKTCAALFPHAARIEEITNAATLSAHKWRTEYESLVSRINEALAGYED